MINRKNSETAKVIEALINGPCKMTREQAEITNKCVGLLDLSYLLLKVAGNIPLAMVVSYIVGLIIALQFWEMELTLPVWVIWSILIIGYFLAFIFLYARIGLRNYAIQTSIDSHRKITEITPNILKPLQLPVRAGRLVNGTYHSCVVLGIEASASGPKNTVAYEDEEIFWITDPSQLEAGLEFLKLSPHNVVVDIDLWYAEFYKNK